MSCKKKKDLYLTQVAEAASSIRFLASYDTIINKQREFERGVSLTGQRRVQLSMQCWKLKDSLQLKHW